MKKIKLFSKEHFKEIAIYSAIYLGIALIWKAYEVVFEGGVQPSVFDSIVALILSLSIYWNIFVYRIISK